MIFVAPVCQAKPLEKVQSKSISSCLSTGAAPYDSDIGHLIGDIASASLANL